MIFSSLVFLFYFLPVVLTVYYLAPARLRNLVALGSSLVFYAWGAPQVVAILLASCAFDYFVSCALVPGSGAPPRRRRALLAGVVALNVALLVYFKYANFAVAEVNDLLGRAGLQRVAWTSVALPIGISFFTFHKITYLVDVYRGILGPARSLVTYWLYITLFPQLVAGPIVRYHDVAEQLERRTHTAGKFLSGMSRFCVGLARKVLVANTLGEAADYAFGLPAAALTASVAWFGAVCYAMQIYFDFAGYSDMAIGLGRMLGIDFLENFNFPYVARNFTEFWRRWHISLSNFMRDYLYIPLGGNRRGLARTYLNLWVVFLLSGFWHGAAWNFVVWGGYHGFFLSVDKFLREARRGRLPDWAAVPATFLLVTIGWVFFRCDSLGHAIRYLRAMAGGSGPPVLTAALAEAARLTDARTLVVLGVAALISFAPAFARQVPGPGPAPASPGPATVLLRYAAGIALLILSAGSIAVSGFNPFIYFRF